VLSENAELPGLAVAQCTEGIERGRSCWSIMDSGEQLAAVVLGAGPVIPPGVGAEPLRQPAISNGR
jgi:hypothetical protein